jgi:ornithine--oxo-acid transaminase
MDSGGAVNGMNSLELIALEEKYGAHNYLPLNVVIERGEGVWVYDVDGRRYLDCLSAYSALNQGHCHPRIVEAMRDQAGRLTLTSRAFRNSELGLFEREICELTGYQKVLPMNSGAEAVETAIKAVRKWGYSVKGIARDQAEVIVCHGNFHGRTITVVGFSSEAKYRNGFGPFTPGFRLIEYGSIEALEEAINPNTVAFLIEPIQGEGGVILPPAGYLSHSAKVCAEHGVLFVADEIQTGLGRTGRLFACDHEDVRPDMIVLGKAVSGGLYPVSLVLADDAVLDLFQPGEHGSTFGGNPLAARVAREAVRVMVEEGLVERAAESGAYLRGRLQRLESPYIKEVRGRGLLIGIELHHELGGARRFCEELANVGVLCKETHMHTIRVAPPLIIGQDEIDWAVERFATVLEG